MKRKQVVSEAVGDVNLSEIYHPVQKDLQKVEKMLEDIADADFALLAELLEYTLKTGGKRVRPALTLLSGKFYVYNLSLLVPMAAAIELLHTATLVHDDIVDNSPVRRGKPTVSRAWGQNSALLLGDYLFAKAGSLVASTGNLRAIKLFSETLMTISAGELKQTAVTFEVARMRDYYFAWIGAKTACLFATSTESGAILSQAPEMAIQAIREYGHNLGMAFQIVDDVLDLVGDEKELGKPVGSDLREGTLTLPTILFIETYPRDDELKNFLMHKGSGDVATALERIRDSKVIDDCLSLAAGFGTKARQAAQKLPDNRARKSLIALTDYIVERRK